MELSTNIESIKGVGEKTSKLYNKLGIYDVSGLLKHIPRKYEDYSHVQKVATLTPGNVTIKAKISSVHSRYSRGGIHITEAIASDNTASVGVIWFNQPYRAKSLRHNVEYFISGKFDFGGNRLSLRNPSAELVSDLSVNSGRILPVYPETKGLSSKQIRKHLANIFALKPKIKETLPDIVCQQNNLISSADAYKQLHRPSSISEIDESRYRLGFEEIFELSIASQSARKEVARADAPKIEIDLNITDQFIKQLPFKLTNAQRKTAWQIYQDISQSKPMNRLLEGDVGSGKTVVAAMASMLTLNQGYQVIFLAPTEILARQHTETFYELLDGVGFQNQITLLVGSMSKKQKEDIKKDVKSALKPRLIIGTHALLQDKIEYQDIGLVITDEQHRFGVNQRRHLLSKTNISPHMLSMTATPIPRSLALTVFGELDVSIINEKPQGRKKVTTQLIKPTDRLKLYQDIYKKIKSTTCQAYVVCPVISPGDTIFIKSVEKVHQELSTLLKGLKIEVLHGKMTGEDKAAIMKKFIKGKVDILISTTVIEVGVNVPNANIMVIESADRFGLAQLHQLRGRIGRGNEQGECYLLTENEPTRRIRAIKSTNDGFKLAELDLELRGAGAIYGTRQHGILDLRVANFSDAKLIAAASRAAKQFMDDPKNLVQYPYIKERIKQLQSVVHLN
ncbi:ATP-dependent DNA helicase RecG [Candidatus Saccharibacteria bacterium]|nr:ATP-dependent DNA helicase RecG [Candidatus Saccharibacteria bacterium]